MGREKRHRTALFSALKGIAALFSTTAPLMHIPADSEQEVALIPSICSIFICLVVDTGGEKFPGNTMEGIPGGGRTDLEIHVRVNACKDSVERLISYGHMTVGWKLCVVKTGGLNATGKAASEPWWQWGLAQ